MPSDKKDFGLLIGKRVKLSVNYGDDVRHYAGYVLENHDEFILFKDRFIGEMLVQKASIIVAEVDEGGGYGRV